MVRCGEIIHQFCRSAMSNLTALVYPGRCAGCGKLLLPERTWCSECWQSLALAMGREYCPTCGIALGPHQDLTLRGKCFNCKKISMPVRGVCRMGSYEGVLAGTVQKFKYSGNIYIGELLSDLLAQSLLDRDWLEEVDVLCPIPIHWTRRLSRGFNQAKIIVERMAPQVDVPGVSLLRRIRPTPQQVGLSAAARKENIKGAFRVKRFWPIEGATVCLVDDVMTTGSTLHEAARTLKRAGVKRVYAVILAKADKL